MHAVAEEYLKKKDKKLGLIINTVGSCQLNHKSRNKYDVLASSIVSQQLSAKASKTIKGRVLKLIGSKSSLNAESILDVDVKQLREAGLSSAKAAYILTLAENIQSGKLDLENLQNEDEDDIYKILISQKGVGNWTAEMFMIFALGKTDVLSTGDAGLIRAAQLVYGLKEKPKPEEFTKIAEKWQPYRSIASWYLWRAID